MAILLDSSSEAYSASTASLVIPHASAGDHLTVGVISARVAVSVTYNGVALTQIVEQETGASNDSQAALFELVAPDAGTHDVVVTLSPASEVWAGVVSRTGVDQAAPSSGGVGDFASSGRAEDFDVVSATGDLVIGLAGTTSDDLAGGAGQTTRAVKSPQVNGERNGLMDDEPGAALVNMAYTWRLNRFAVMVGASLKAATGGAAVELAATLTGTGAISADVQVGRPLTATLAGTGAVNAAVQVARPLSATLDGTGGLDAPVRVVRHLAADLSGTGDVQAAVTVHRTLSATLAGTGGLTADVSVTQDVELAAVLMGTGGLDAEVAVHRTLSATLAGRGDLVSAVTVTRRLAATLAGTGGLSADVSVGEVIAFDLAFRVSQPLATSLRATPGLGASFRTSQPLSTGLEAAPALHTTTAIAQPLALTLTATPEDT